MKSQCKIKQQDLTDCGVACLASIAAHYGLFLSIGKLRQFASTDKSGTNIAGMIRAAEKIQMFAKGVKGELKNLPHLPLPVIAHVVRNNVQHYVVVYKIRKTSLLYMDPADGQYHTQSLEDFKKMWTGILVLIIPKPTFEKADIRLSHSQWYAELIRDQRFLIVQGLIAAVVYTLLGLTPSVYIQKIVDHVLPDQNFRLLNLLTGFMIASLIIQVTIGYIKSLFILQTGQQIDAKLVLGYYRHLLRLPQTFFDSMQVGEIVSRVNDAVKIRAFINNTGIEIILNIFIILFSLLMMIVYNWKLAMLVLTIFPAYILVYIVNNSINKKWQRRLMENAAKVESQLVESLANIRTIKRFSVEEYFNLKIERTFVDLLKNVFRSSNYSLYLASSTELLLRLITIGMLGVGSYYVLRNQLTTGELLSFYSLVGYFTAPAASLVSANKSLQDALAAGNRLFDILDLGTEPGAENKLHLDSRSVADISFENVHFSYGTGRTLFNGLSMTIRTGQSTAIVGESGSGKSTLLFLMQNIYNLEKGSIRIGDFNINSISNDSLRKCISVVPQEIQLISGTVIENIALGDYEPDIKKIINISTLLGVNEFVETRPGHYNSFLGEQGIGLSGGQRQRLAIARALYRDPEILMLDEATASLDNSSASKVQDALNWFLGQGKTLIIISHRLSTIRTCDSIKVLKDGRLVEEGTHEELIRMGNHYKSLWNGSENASA